MPDWWERKIGLPDLVRVLSLVENPPNLRQHPQGADRTDRYFEEWFDGGAICRTTGGPTQYVFDDGIEVKFYWFSPALLLVVQFPDGSSVTIEQSAAAPA